MKNDEATGMMMTIGLIVVAAYFIAAFIFALVAFASCIMTVVAIIAWIKPFTLFGEEVTREEGRSFIVRGIVGAWLLMTFAAFCEALFDLTIPDNIYVYVGVCGYAFGSLFVGYAIEQERANAKAQATPVRPVQEVLPPPSPPAQRPFTFAGWDDEDEFR